MRTVGEIIIRVLYFIAMLCACAGLWVLFQSMGGEVNAIQSSGISAFGVGLAVVPYCIARCLDRVMLGGH